MTDTVPDPNPEQTARLVARVRRMMMIAALTTGIGVAALFGVIGYRLFKAGESPAVAAPTTTVTLPKAARIVATAVAGDRLVLTLDVAGATEIRTFDVHSLKPAGRLTFATEP